MDVLEKTSIIVFWACTAGVLYTYVVYPCLVHLLAGAFGRKQDPPQVTDQQLPNVSLLICAYNEEAVIEHRLRNALAIDYPPEKLEIVVASDGSTDQTVEIVRRFVGDRVRLLAFPERRGKAAVLSSAFESLTGDIVVLSDANTMTHPDAARKLARWFADPGVGVVCGRLVLTDPSSRRNADGSYWKYETFLKKREAELGALLGSNGAIYAIRREYYVPIRPDTIVDDFVIPLLAKLQREFRIVYDADAIAHEETAPDVKGEFRRRVRIGAGGFQAISMLWRLLSPLKGWLALAFFSHKILRWFCPFMLLAILAASILLCSRKFYAAMLALQVGYYGVSALCLAVPSLLHTGRPVRVGVMFASMNAALLMGFWRWFFGKQKVTWTRTARPAEVAETMQVG